MSNQRQIFQAMALYTIENQGWGPESTYLQGPDDFNSNPAGYYVAWWCQPLLGKYLRIVTRRIITRGKDYNPSTYSNWGAGKYDPAASFLYCPAYDTHGPNSDLGYGLNVRYGARMFRSDGATLPQIKLTSVRGSSKVILLADVYNGIMWEKYYYNETSPYNATGGGASGLVWYRHGNSTCVTFVDGHGEVFLDTRPTQAVAGYQTGLHAASDDTDLTGAYMSGNVTGKWNAN
jgi:hypothetical protein